MLPLILLFFLPLAFSTIITRQENCYLKQHCGDHFLRGPALKFSPGKPAVGSRIRGGSKAKKNEFPWIVGFYHNGNAGCSGVQISQHHVLTSARCVVENSTRLQEQCKSGSIVSNRQKYHIKDHRHFTLFVGSGCTNPEHCWRNHTNYVVTNITVYKDYNPCDSSGDLALMEIFPPVLPTDGSPVCMAESKSLLGAKLTAVGFGADTLSVKNDSDQLSDLRYVVLSKTSENPSLLTMASYSKSICKGDTGGPLTRDTNQANYSLRGIGLFAHPPCDRGSPKEYRTSYFTDVRNYVDWICTNTGVCTIKDFATECNFPRLIILPPKNDRVIL
ncbi:trypsin [Dictyocaulus viviparus]|uniref:Trypsin n=1 Tax=Dictyocaulus viviparus TaxID=29172 RepID=A0A0D8XRE2_DICVI|nr:trypsin [Dictyocaulus viviparus]